MTLRTEEQSLETTMTNQKAVPPAAPHPATGKLPEVTIYAPDGSYPAIGGDYYDRRAAPQPDIERILQELTDPSISDARVAVLRDELIRARAAPQTPAEPPGRRSAPDLQSTAKLKVPQQS